MPKYERAKNITKKEALGQIDFLLNGVKGSFNGALKFAKEHKFESMLQEFTDAICAGEFVGRTIDGYRRNKIVSPGMLGESELQLIKIFDTKTTEIADILSKIASL